MPQSANLLRKLVLKALPASVALTPRSANFLKVLGSIEAQPQAITIEGRGADLRATRLLTGATVPIVIQPRSAGLLRQYPLPALLRSIAISPAAANLRMSRRLLAVKQDIAISPKAIDLVYSPTTVSISFVSSAQVDAATITMPTVQTGDFVFLADMAAMTNSGSPQATPPTISGFTPLVRFPITGDDGGATRNDIYIWTYGRIVTNGAGESGGTITGSSLGATSGFRRKTLLVFRGSTPLTTMGSAESASKVWSTGDPSATSTALSAGTAPFIAFAAYRGSGALTGLALSPTADGEVLNGTTTSVRYKIYNTADAGSFAADMGDSGSANIMASFLVELL